MVKYPIIWYRDASGAWERLKNRLLINKLVFMGNISPSNSAATKEAIQDLSILCKNDGADISTVSSKPLTFSALVAELERLGILAPNADPKAAPPSKPSSSVELETSLSDHFAKEESEICKHNT